MTITRSLVQSHEEACVLAPFHVEEGQAHPLALGRYPSQNSIGRNVMKKVCATRQPPLHYVPIAQAETKTYFRTPQSSRKTYPSLQSLLVSASLA